MLASSVVWWSVVVVVGTAVMLCLVLAVGTIYRGWAFLQVSTVSDSNSDQAAVEQFIALLGEAERSMVVHDDGNKMDGSIYESEAVIDAVRQKIAKDGRFRLSCHFNFGGTRFTKEFERCPAVRITIGQGDRPDDDVHYKIIDCGRKAHLSSHKLNSKERRYKMVDCGKVPRRLMAHVTDVLLGRYKNHARNLGIWLPA